MNISEDLEKAANGDRGKNTKKSSHRIKHFSHQKKVQKNIRRKINSKKSTYKPLNIANTLDTVGCVCVEGWVGFQTYIFLPYKEHKQRKKNVTVKKKRRGYAGHIQR